MASLPKATSHIVGTGTASLRRIQFVNSMELVVHLGALATWNVKFNPRFGLGHRPSTAAKKCF